MRFFRRGESASTLDLLVVGLGNPGRKHERDRHNVGWLVVDELADRTDARWRAKFSGQLAEVRLDGLRLAPLKPETFMNESGRSLAAAARVFKGEPEGLLRVPHHVHLQAGRPPARARGGPPRRTPRPAPFRS